MKYICDKIEATLIINGQPKTINRKNVSVEIKQPRNIKHLAKYWKLMEFLAFNAPEWREINTKDDADDYIKEQLGKRIYAPDGSISHVKKYSISFATMDQIQFDEHYKRSLDICAKVIGVAPETVINELVGFF